MRSQDFLAIETEIICVRAWVLVRIVPREGLGDVAPNDGFSIRFSLKRNQCVFAESTDFRAGARKYKMNLK